MDRSLTPHRRRRRACAPRTRRKPKPPAPCSPGSDPRFGICSRPRGADCQSFAAPSSPVAGPAGRAPRRRRRSDRATRSHRWTEIVGSSSSPTYDEVHFRPVAATISKGSRALDGQHVWRPLSAGGHAARCARRFAPRLRQRADRQRPGTQGTRPISCRNAAIGKVNADSLARLCSRIYHLRGHVLTIELRVKLRAHVPTALSHTKQTLDTCD